MANEPDMDAPITRRELNQALEVWAGAIIEKLSAKLDQGVAEMRALVKASERAVLDRVEAMLDPYRAIPERVSALEHQALPERVSKLEAKVFAPKRRPTAARRKRS